VAPIAWGHRGMLAIGGHPFRGKGSDLGIIHVRKFAVNQAVTILSSSRFNVCDIRSCLNLSGARLF
jgi:hypothetical protein